MVVGLVSGLLQAAGGVFLGLLAGIVRLVGYAIYAGFVVRLVQDVREGRAPRDRRRARGPIGNGEAATWVAAIISSVVTAPIFAPRGDLER